MPAIWLCPAPPCSALLHPAPPCSALLRPAPPCSTLLCSACYCTTSGAVLKMFGGEGGDGGELAGAGRARRGLGARAPRAASL